MNPTSTADAISPDLVRCAQGGERDALEALTRKAYPLVRRWALVRLGDPADADDLTQDVLVQMIRRLSAFRGSSAFTTWLYTVTRNAALDRARGAGRRRRATTAAEAAGALVPEGVAGPEAELRRSRAADLLRAFFTELSERQREVFDLAELQGLTSPEIAEMLDIEPVSVRAHLFKARRALRARILERHPELAEEYS